MTIDYDSVWTETWGDMQDLGPVHRHSRRILVDLAKPLGVYSILDVGCGNGANLALLQRELATTDVVGVDISPTALDVARARVRGELLVADLTQPLVLDRRFDLVISSQVIEHLPDDDAFLANLRRLSSRYVLVATMQGRMRASEPAIGHLRNYTRRGLEAQMRAAGIVPLRAVEWGFPFYSPLYRSAIEVIGGQTADVGHNRRDQLVAKALYQLYRFNSHRRGDVLTILGRVAD